MAFKVSVEAAKRTLDVLDSFDGEVDMALSETSYALRSLGGYTDRVGSESRDVLRWIKRGEALGTMETRVANLRTFLAGEVKV